MPPTKWLATAMTRRLYKSGVVSGDWPVGVLCAIAQRYQDSVEELLGAREISAAQVIGVSTRRHEPTTVPLSLRSES
jgi:hypothetical protein